MFTRKARIAMSPLGFPSIVTSNMTFERGKEGTPMISKPERRKASKTPPGMNHRA